MYAWWTALALAKDPTEVTFRFGWAAGDVATAAIESLDTAKRDGHTYETMVKEALQLAVRADGAGLAVRETIVAVAETQRVDGVPQAAKASVAFLEALSKVDTDAKIAADGTFAGLVDDALYRQQLTAASDAFFAGVLAKITDPDKRARADAAFESLRKSVSADASIAETAADWRWETAFWSGRTLKVGESLKAEGDERVVTFGLTGTSPCSDERHAPLCADVTLNVQEGGVDSRRVGRVEVATLRPWSWTQDDTLPDGGTRHHSETWVWTP